MVAEFIAAGDSIAERYENREFNKAIREIVALADRANQYIDEKKPWVLAKQEGEEKQVHEVCSVGVNLFRVLMTYLKPVLPEMAEKTEGFLNCSLDWTALDGPLLGHELSKFKPLLTRIEPKQVEAMVEASRQETIFTSSLSVTAMIISACSMPASRRTDGDEPLPSRT